MWPAIASTSPLTPTQPFNPVMALSTAAGSTAALPACGGAGAGAGAGAATQQPPSASSAANDATTTASHGVSSKKAKIRGRVFAIDPGHNHNHNQQYRPPSLLYPCVLWFVVYLCIVVVRYRCCAIWMLLRCCCCCCCRYVHTTFSLALRCAAAMLVPSPAQACVPFSLCMILMGNFTS